MNKTFTCLVAALSFFSVGVSAQTASDTIDASEFFPLDELNAHIWDPDNKATYDAETHSLTTAQYGFGGWQYETPVDLSDYQTLIINLKEAQTTGANFRMFDENNYWASCTQTDMGNATSVSIDLTTIKKVDGDSLVDFDPSHVYIAGFWSYGDSPIQIESLKLVKKDTSAVVSGESFWPLSEITHIWDPDSVASYDADTQSLTTGVYGFSGWQNETGWDLSSYSSIVITLQEASTAGPQWRMYDVNNYWNDKFSKTEFGDATSVTVDLTSLQKMTDSGTDAEDFDASQVYIAGFWSYGNAPIKIQSIKLKRAVTDGIHNVATDEVITNDAPVYNLMGVKVATAGSFDSLPQGIYLVNGKKILKR